MDQTEKIIEAVKKYDCLYNLQSSNYKNYELKEDIWNKISEEIDINVKEVKKKWKNIRDSYRKCKQRINLPSGSEVVFPKPYKYSESLRFLSDVPPARRTTDNADEDSMDPIEVSSDAEESYRQVPKMKKRNSYSVQETMQNFLETASASIIMTESKPNSTSQLFQTLSSRIDEASLTASEICEIEGAVCSLVYSKLAAYRRNNN